MEAKNQLFRLFARASRWSGAGRIFAHRYAGIGSVLVMHSVVEHRRDYLCEPLRTSAGYLRDILAHLRTQDIDFIDLDAALDRMHMPHPRPFICFTFDDGYRDNLTIALPIFEAFGVPFTVYVTTCFVERQLDNWWDGLVVLLQRNDTVDLPELASRFDVRSIPQKQRAYARLKAAVGKGEITRDALEQVFRRHKITIRDLNDRDALTVDELRQLASHPLVTIGGHTTNHRRLATLQEGEAREEIVSNKRWLEATLDLEVRHFAYPYGDSSSCEKREALLVEDAGFVSGVTTRIGNLFGAHANGHTFALPRLRSFSFAEDTSLIDFQRSGAANAVLSGFGSPIVTF